MATHYNRSHDLIHIQIRPDDGPGVWTPTHRFNLTGKRSIPFTTYAKFVVDTATSLGQGGDKGFFKSQAQTHIAHVLEFLFELSCPVFLNQPEEQHGGVRETIGNYLQYFLTPEVAEVFCTEESTFDFSTIDQGKII